MLEKYDFKKIKSAVDRLKPKNKSREEYDAEYRNRPEVKQRAKEYRERQDVKERYRERKRLWMVEYRKRPGIAEKEREYARNRKIDEKEKFLRFPSKNFS